MEHRPLARFVTPHAAAQLDVPRGNVIDGDPRSQGGERIGEAAHRTLTALIWPALAALPGLIVIPMLWAQLGPIDDHQVPLIQYMAGGSVPIGRIPEVASWFWIETSRFRPFYWLARVTEIAFWGQWAPGWYLDRLFLLLVSLGSLWSIARWFVGQQLATLACVLLVAGPQAEAWYRLGPQEALAVPLLLAGTSLVLGGQRWGGLILLILAALSKEAFVPFALLAALANGRRPSTAAAAAIIVAIGSVSAWLFVTGSAQYGLSRDPISIVLTAGWAFVVTPAMWLAPLALRSRLAIGGAALWAASVAIYAGLDFGRYLLPGALLGIAATTWYLRSHPRLVRPALAVALGAIVIQAGLASAAAARTRAWAVTVASVRAALTAQPDAELVVSFAWPDRESAISLLRFVGPARAALVVPPDPPPDAAAFIQSATTGPLSYASTITSCPCIPVTVP